jgi:phosphopantothenoylcysteine decarboxylase/phosphopantothenate--cysteine ligase
MSLKGKKILLGVSGSIAAYKTAHLVRDFVKKGAEVQVIMTADATAFISPLTLATLSKKPCLTQYINADGSDWNNHVALGLWGDVFIIAPATANTLSKMATGQCDNLLLGVYLSARCPVFVAPAMDEDMWHHPSTQANLATIQSFGNTIIPVNSGELASGLFGEGRMAEPEEIAAFLENHFAFKSNLRGKKVVITAGPTYEPIDPVRFIGNFSSGRMGIDLAEEATKRGAEVFLILGPTHLQPKSAQIKVTKVKTGAEMLAATEVHFKNADILIFAAAVADYTPANPAAQKIKKSEEQMQLTLQKTTDIAKTFGSVKTSNQISVGFALETENEVEFAQEKRKKKNFDLIVLNSLNDEGAGFKHATNKITLIDANNNIEKFELKSKEKVAIDILNKVETLL